MVAFVPMKPRQGYDVTDHMTTHVPPSNQVAFDTSSSGGPGPQEPGKKVIYGIQGGGQYGYPGNTNLGQVLKTKKAGDKYTGQHSTLTGSYE